MKIIEVFNLLGEEEGLVQVENGYMCITCGKIISNLYNGNRHVQEKHRSNQRAQCKICKKFYKNIRHRNDHYKMTHGVSAKQMNNLIKVPESSATKVEEHYDDEVYYE